MLVGVKVILLFSDPSANGTPSSKSLVMTAAKSLKNSSSSLAYFSTCDLKALSDTRAMSVGSIMRDLDVLSWYCSILLVLDLGVGGGGHMPA